MAAKREPMEVREVPGQPGMFEVKGSRWYRVTLSAAPTCDCPHFAHRCRGTDRVCKHIAAALSCPVCQGEGYWRPSGVISYPDMAPIPLPCCMGEGTRAAWVALGCSPPAPESVTEVPAATAGDNATFTVDEWWNALPEDEKLAIFA